MNRLQINRLALHIISNPQTDYEPLDCGKTEEECEECEFCGYDDCKEQKQMEMDRKRYQAYILKRAKLRREKCIAHTVTAK